MELFIKYGEVQVGKLIEDRGVGFLKTKEQLNDTEFVCRSLEIDESLP